MHSSFYTLHYPFWAAKSDLDWVFLIFKKFAQQIFVSCTTHLLSILMLLRFAQRCCGLLAAVMCIFILGPIAICIESGRIIRSAIVGEPIIWTRWLQLLPMFAVCCGLIVCAALLLGIWS
jgi:hypothetical protein